MAKKDLSYQQAFDEIQQILSDIEKENIDLDSLNGKVKKATELIALCKEKLHAIDKDLEKLLNN
jgi:exodeoxyribonuclease VII small subunit